MEEKEGKDNYQLSPSLPPVLIVAYYFCRMRFRKKGGGNQGRLKYGGRESKSRDITVPESFSFPSPLPFPVTKAVKIIVNLFIIYLDW